MNRRRFLQLSGMSLAVSLWSPWQSISHIHATQDIATWQTIPLTTWRMRALGIAGGDGFQYVHAISYAPSDPSIAYLSVDQSGVWRSEDGGKSWTPKFKGFLAYGARSIAVDPFNPQILFAAGFLGFRRKGAMKYPRRHQGIYRTLDGGDSWRVVRQTDFFKQVSKGQLVLFQPSTEPNSHRDRCRTVWCASASEGLLLSLDGGDTWQATNCTDTHIHDLALSGERQSSVLVASRKGLFLFENGILEKIGDGLPDFPRSIATSINAPQRVYAAVGKNGVAVSDDGGRRFRPLKQFLMPPIDVTDIAVSPVDAEKVYIRANLSSRPPLYQQ